MFSKRTELTHLEKKALDNLCAQINQTNDQINKDLVTERKADDWVQAQIQRRDCFLKKEQAKSERQVASRKTSGIVDMQYKIKKIVKNAKAYAWIIAEKMTDEQKESLRGFSGIRNEEAIQKRLFGEKTELTLAEKKGMDYVCTKINEENNKINEDLVRTGKVSDWVQAQIQRRDSFLKKSQANNKALTARRRKGSPIKENLDQPLADKKEPGIGTARSRPLTKSLPDKPNPNLAAAELTGATFDLALPSLPELPRAAKAAPPTLPPPPLLPAAPAAPAPAARIAPAMPAAESGLPVRPLPDTAAKANPRRRRPANISMKTKIRVIMIDAKRDAWIIEEKMTEEEKASLGGYSGIRSKENIKKRLFGDETRLTPKQEQTLDEVCTQINRTNDESNKDLVTKEEASDWKQAQLQRRENALKRNRKSKHLTKKKESVGTSRPMAAGALSGVSDPNLAAAIPSVAAPAALPLSPPFPQLPRAAEPAPAFRPSPLLPPAAAAEITPAVPGLRLPLPPLSLLLAAAEPAVDPNLAAGPAAPEPAVDPNLAAGPAAPEPAADPNLAAAAAAAAAAGTTAEPAVDPNLAITGSAVAPGETPNPLTDGDVFGREGLLPTLLIPTGPRPEIDPKVAAALKICGFFSPNERVVADLFPELQEHHEPEHKL